MRLARIIVGILVLLALLWVGAQSAVRYIDRDRNTVIGGENPTPSPRAQRIHHDLFIADLHADPLLWPRDMTRRLEHGHVDLPRLIEGNVGLQVFGVVTKTPSNLNYERNTAYTDDITLLAIASGWPLRTWGHLEERALFQADKLQALIDASQGQMTLIRSRTDLEALVAAREAGEDLVGALLALEGAHALAGELDNLERLFDAGFRMLGLAHFFDNEVTGSAHGVQKAGLTEFGRQVLDKAWTLGMVIDLAHASEHTVRQVLRDSPAPVVFSHSGVRATCEQSGRNLDDRTLKQLRRNGGVVGIGLWPYAICTDDLSGFFDAVDHAVQLAGIDHVGLGSDFDGTISAPIDASQWLQVTSGLLERGYSRPQIKKLMGGNIQRVLMETLPVE